MHLVRLRVPLFPHEAVQALQVLQLCHWQFLGQHPPLHDLLSVVPPTHALPAQDASKAMLLDHSKSDTVKYKKYSLHGGMSATLNGKFKSTGNA